MQLGVLGAVNLFKVYGESGKVVKPHNLCLELCMFSAIDMKQDQSSLESTNGRFSGNDARKAGGALYAMVKNLIK